jgi:hypothetical protein
MCWNTNTLLKEYMMNISLLNRRGWLLTGMTGLALTGGVVMAGSAAFAAEAGDTTAAAPQVTALSAMDTAAQRVPDCEIVGVQLHESDEESVWEVELTCPNSTTQYVEISGDDGSDISINDDYSAGDDATGDDGEPDVDSR